MGIALIALLVGSVSGPATASHDRRIVLPYGLSETHYPVVAGFELIPDPFICGAGEPTSTATTYFSEDFSTAGWTTIDSYTFHPSPSTNLWHRTTFAGAGTNTGHSANGHMYYGKDATGNYDVGRSSGDIVSGSMSLSSGDRFLSFNTKWNVEWFNGYDHMWIQIDDLNANGGVDDSYILCKLNPPARPDASSSSTTTPACSPEMFGPCPNLQNSLAGVIVPDLDATAPHWESRYVEIPSFLQGTDIRIRFSFDSSDPVSNHFMGWMLDDVKITNDIDASFPATPTEV